MKDFVGNTLKEGDKVVILCKSHHSSWLYKTEIMGFTKEMVITLWGRKKPKLCVKYSEDKK